MNDCSRELSGEKFRGVVQIDESAIRSELGELVRGSVDETLNGLLEAEADELCGAKRYARSPDRVDTRTGHYQRKLQTRAGEVTLQVPRLRSLPFTTVDRHLSWRFNSEPHPATLHIDSQFPNAVTLRVPIRDAFASRCRTGLPLFTIFLLDAPYPRFTAVELQGDRVGTRPLSRYSQHFQTPFLRVGHGNSFRT